MGGSGAGIGEGFFANRYLAFDDGVTMADGRIAYSRDGTDVAAEVVVPGLRWVSGGATYYRWEGRHGDEDDRGMRYNLGFDVGELFGGGDFWGGLDLGVEFDRPVGKKGDWAGKVSYTHRFGAATPGGPATATEGFDPRAHFFDPVRREYAQRISKSKLPEDVGIPIYDVRATAVAGSGQVEVATVFAGATSATVSVVLLTERGPEAMYQSGSTVEVNSSMTSAISVYTEAWTVLLAATTTVDFENSGSRLSLRNGGVWVERSAGITMLVSRSVTVNFFGTTVSMQYPHVRSLVTLSVNESAATVAVTVAVTVALVDLREGRVSINVDGALAAYLSLTVSSEEVTATVVYEQGRGGLGLLGW